MKLTQEQIDALIEKVQYAKVGEKTTICVLTTKNGFEIVTSSSCINADDYDEKIGGEIAYLKAIDKLREFEGYKNHL